MGRPKQNGHIRTFYHKQYRLISVMVNGIRRQRFEHRLVMEKVLGRALTPEEIVHHKDEDGLNNSPDNLELTTSHDHQHMHLMVGPHKWNLEIAIEMRENGATFFEIADLYNVSYTAIMAAFRRRGLSTVSQRWGKTKWDIESAIILLNEGVSIRHIAKKAGVSAPTVHKAFAQRGLVAPHKNERQLKILVHPLNSILP